MAMEITFPGGKKVDALFKGFTIQTDQLERDGGDWRVRPRCLDGRHHP